MVPPSSDRVPRAPPYSWTAPQLDPYGTVTLCGAPFQTLPVAAARPLAWSAFARRYSRSRGCFPFLRLLRCFSSPGSPHRTLRCGDAPDRGRVAPFGDPGITGRTRLPRAFRSVPRPSSPLGAEASTGCPLFSRPAPADHDRGPPDRGTPAASPTLSTMSRNDVVVGLGRFERPTSRLSGVRSDRLSYRPGTAPHSTPLGSGAEGMGRRRAVAAPSGRVFPERR